MTNFFDITLAGTETFNALLLLLLAVAPTSDEFIEAQVMSYINKVNRKFKHSKEVTEMVRWIVSDNFQKETYNFISKNRYTQVYMDELQSLKDRIIDFYFKKLEEFESDNDFQMSCDIHTTIGQYVIRLMRLRMVIEPEVNIVTNPKLVNITTGEKTLYLTAKGFWIGDDGKKFRKFTKSIGRMSDYPGAREGKAAMEESIKRLQSMMWDEYRVTYP